MSDATPRDEVRRYRFGLGALEFVELEVWQAGDAAGVLRARLWGIASAWDFQGAGALHPEIYIEIATDPESISDDPLEALMREAYEGSVEDATELADELERMAYDEWFRDMEQQVDS